MMKKNKLYTVNRWNQPAFAYRENLFFGGGSAAVWDKLASKNDYQDTDAYRQSKNWLGIAKEDNPFSAGNLKSAFSKEGIGSVIKGAGPGLFSAGAGIVGGIAGNAISGGLESGAGNAIGSIGSTIGGAVGAVNPVLGAAVTVGSQLIGGLTNRAFGMAVDQEKLNAAKAGTEALNNFRSEATTFKDITGPMAQENVQDAYRGGWFSSDEAEKKNEQLRYLREEAKNQAYLQVANNARNIADDQLGTALANYASLGGLLNGNKKGNKMNRMTQMPIFMNNFALGGDVQMHGADYSVGEIYDVSEKEVKRLKSMGYEFTVVS